MSYIEHHFDRLVQICREIAGRDLTKAELYKLNNYLSLIKLDELDKTYDDLKNRISVAHEKETATANRLRI